MRLFLILPIGIALAGCESQQSVAPELQTIADGAVTVRLLDSGGSQEPHFEIVASEPGWLTVVMGPERRSMGFPISTTPGRYLLRVVRDEYDGTTILDQYVSPLLGAAAIEQLRAQQPAAADQKLILTTLVVEGAEGDNVLTLGPITTVIPSPRGSSQFSTLARSRSTREPGVRLAAWLQVPRPSEEPGRVRAGIGPDTMTLEVDGEPVTLEEAGAVFEELSIEYSPQSLRAATERDSRNDGAAGP